MPSIVYLSHPLLENLYPLTPSDQSLPNQHLLGKPVALRIAETLWNNGYKDLIVAYPRISGEVREALEEKAVLIDTVDMTFWEGLKEACSKAAEDSIVLVLGTSLFQSDFMEGLIVNWDEEGRRPMIGIITPEENLELKGPLRINVEVDFIGKTVTHAVDLSESGAPVSSYSFSGSIIASKKWCLEKMVGSNDPYEHLLKLFNRDKPGFYYYTGKYVVLNNPWGLLEATKSLLASIKGVLISEKAKVSPTAVLEGPVIIDEHAFVDHYSVIKGPVYIGRKALIGAHSFIRSYASVEEQAVVGSGAEVKRSYLGRRSTIGSKSHITDSLVGEEATIRPLVITLNYDPRRAMEEKYVKKGSIIGYRSLVNGGTVLPPGEEVGPEKVYP